MDSATVTRAASPTTTVNATTANQSGKPTALAVNGSGISKYPSSIMMGCPQCQRLTPTEAATHRPSNQARRFPDTDRPRPDQGRKRLAASQQASAATLGRW